MVRFCLLVLVGTLVAGCSSDPDRDLFGMWTGKMKDLEQGAPKYTSVKLNLRSDHTYETQTALTAGGTGKWSVAKDKLTLAGSEPDVLDIDANRKSISDQELTYSKD